MSFIFAMTSILAWVIFRGLVQIVEHQALILLKLPQDNRVAREVNPFERNIVNFVLIRKVFARSLPFLLIGLAVSMVVGDIPTWIQSCVGISILISSFFFAIQVHTLRETTAIAVLLSGVPSEEK